MSGRLAWVVLVFPALFACRSGGLESRLKEGDIIFQSNRSHQMMAIQRATLSRYSHVGLVTRRHGKWGVYEAVGPVKFTPLKAWISRGVNGHFVVKRLKNNGLLTESGVRSLSRAAAAFSGKPYDFRFLWDDKEIYCSELVWKAYERGLGVELSPIRAYRDFDLTNPVVQVVLRERFGEKVPLDEPVVAPVDLFDSPKLTEIARGRRGGRL